MSEAPAGEQSAGPLAGLKVLELANLFAGPTVGAMLADLGAEVVKVEPPGGDQFRVLGGGHSGRPSAWTLVSRSKRFVTLDDKRPEGVKLLARLTEVCDIVISNQPQLLLERMGCTFEQIAQRNPGAIVVHLSGWGRTGPYADRVANGTIGEAYSGLMHHQRDATGTPNLTGVLYGDHLTALSAVIGTLAACHWRSGPGEGRGQLVDVAMYEGLLTILGPQLIAWDPDAARDAPERSSGLRAAFETRDGRWVLVTAYSDSQITRLLSTAGVAPPEQGLPETKTLHSLVQAWVRDHELSSVVASFREARVQVSPINDFAALAADPQTVHRESILEIAHPEFGTVRIPHPSPRFSASPTASPRAAGELGSDNDTVYRDWLAVGEDELRTLADAEII